MNQNGNEKYSSNSAEEVFEAKEKTCVKRKLLLINFYIMINIIITCLRIFNSFRLIEVKSIIP